MQVVLSGEQSRQLPSGAIQTYPDKWTGDLPDAWAVELIEAGAAHPILMPTPMTFTADQHAVLAAAADAAIQATQAPEAAAAPAEDPDAIPAAKSKKKVS